MKDAICYAPPIRPAMPSLICRFSRRKAAVVIADDAMLCSALSRHADDVICARQRKLFTRSERPALLILLYCRQAQEFASRKSEESWHDVGRMSASLMPAAALVGCDAAARLSPDFALISRSAESARRA